MCPRIANGAEAGAGGASRVLLVGDHTVLGIGLRAVIDRERDLVVAGDVATLEEAVGLAGEVDAHVILVDGDVSDVSVHLDRRAQHERPVLMLSRRSGAEDVRAAFEAGVSGYVLASADEQELVRAIRALAAGERYLHPALGALLAQPAPPPGPIDELSSRERDVLRLLALGHTNDEIARELVISVRTVESHRARLMTRLRATTRAQMVRHALAGGLLDDER